MDKNRGSKNAKMSNRGFLTEEEFIWCHIRMFFHQSKVENISCSLHRFSPQVSRELSIEQETPVDIANGAISAFCDAISLWCVWGG